MSLRLLGKSAAVYAIGHVGLRAASFLLIPMYTRLLNESEFGLFCTLTVTLQILLILFSAGVHESYIRFAKEAEDTGRMGALLGVSLAVNVAAGIAVGGATLLFLGPFFRHTLHCDHVAGYLTLTCLAALTQALTALATTYYRAANRPAGHVAAGLSAAALMIVFNVLFMKVLRWGVYGALTAQIAAYGVVFAAVALHIFPATGLSFSRDYLRRSLRFGAPLVVSQAAWFVMGGSAVFFLSRYSGLESVAAYSLGDKLAQIVNMAVILPFQLAYAPYVFANLGQPNIRESMSRAMTAFVLGFGLAAVGVAIGSRALLTIAAPANYDRASSVAVLLLLLPANLFIGVHVFGKTLLAIRNKTQVTGAVAAVFAALGLLLNYWLVPRYHWLGAVAATNITYGLTGFVILVLGLRAFPVRVEVKKVSVALGVFAAAGVLFLCLQRASGAAFYGGGVIAAAAGAVLLWKAGALDSQEKAFVAGLAKRIRYGGRQ